MGAPKIDSLQGLRLIAFLGICSGHCQVTQLGAWGVSIFFVLSGFVMTYRHYGDDIQSDVVHNILNSIKRIKKLYVLHIIMMISAIIYIERIVKGEVTYLEVFSNIILIQSWIPQMDIYFSLNGVAWFLSDMVFMYFLFPYLLKLVNRLFSIQKIIFVMVIVYTFQCIIGYSFYVNSDLFKDIIPDLLHWIVYICPVFRIGDFSLGICAAIICVRDKENRIEAYYSSWFEILSIAIIIVSYIFWKKEISFLGEEWFCNSLIWLPSSVVLCVCTYYGKGVISKLLAKKVFVEMGDLCSYMFLIHSMVIAYIRTLLQILGVWSPARLFLIVFPLTIISSFIYRFLEQRYMKL